MFANGKRKKKQVEENVRNDFFKPNFPSFSVYRFAAQGAVNNLNGFKTQSV